MPLFITVSSAYFVDSCFKQSQDYRMVGNFWGRKLSRIGENTIFADKTFADCSLLPRQRMPRTKFFGKKTFAYSHKTAKFAKVFSLESFPLYSTFFQVVANTSLIPRPLPDFISQQWRKIGWRPGIKTASQTGNGGLGWYKPSPRYILTKSTISGPWRSLHPRSSPNFSPRLRDKIWE